MINKIYIFGNFSRSMDIKEDIKRLEKENKVLINKVAKALAEVHLGELKCLETKKN